jgi:hypothetical protein
MDGLYNFLNTHQFYGLLIIILIIWAGMFMYVKNLGSKIKALAKNRDE